MTGLEMRALYYVLFPIRAEGEDRQRYLDNMKANENNLNQNFTILAQKLQELEARLSILE